MSEYINRDTALSFPFANGQYDHKNANEHFIFGCETYREWLEQLPVEDVRPVQCGRWGKDQFRSGYGRYVCSECKSSFQIEESGGTPTWKYCPVCGSYKGGEDENKREDCH